MKKGKKKVLTKERDPELGVQGIESEDAGAQPADGNALSADDISRSADAVQGAGDECVEEAALGDNDGCPAEAEGKVSSDVKQRFRFIDPAYNKRVPHSILAALIGAFLGLFPATICAYLIKTAFYPLFLAAPLLALVFNRLFKGCRDTRTLIITAVFSLLSAYVTALACQIAIIVSYLGVTILQIPTLVVEALANPNILPMSTSAYVYPLVFTALGVAVIWELLQVRQKEQPESGEGTVADNAESDDEAATDNAKPGNQ